MSVDLYLKLNLSHPTFVSTLLGPKRGLGDGANLLRSSKAKMRPNLELFLPYLIRGETG